MARVKRSPLHRQLARVHRRLVVQALLNRLIGCWTGALLLAALWFLGQPYLIEAPAAWLRWAVAGGALGLATAAAVALTLLRAPSKLAAALSLDSEFGLKERVTTSLTLAPEQEASPAGQALLADVNQRLGTLDVGSRFPVRLAWPAALLPVCAALLAVVAVFYQPARSQATAANPTEAAQLPPNAAEIAQKMRDLKKKPLERPEKTKAKSEELQKLEAELEKIANRPHETKEQLHERIKEMTALEDLMKNRARELAERSRSLKQQLQRLDQLGQQSADGPARDLQKALAEGKFDKAREEIERLNKRLLANELTGKDKEQLKRQLKDLQDKLTRLAQQKDKEQKLHQANLDPKTLERELAGLKKESQKLSGLQDLANKLGQCQKALKDGDMEGASQSLSQASDKLKGMEAGDEDLQDLRDQLARLQDAKDSC